MNFHQKIEATIGILEKFVSCVHSGSGFPSKIGNLGIFTVARRVTSIFTISLLLQVIVTLSSLQAHADSSIEYRVQITIDNANIYSTLSSFPVYVDLSLMPVEFWENVIDGGDIRVFEVDGQTETAFELVSIDVSSQTGELHFLADSLASDASTEFYIQYGNSNTSPYPHDDTYGSDNAWNANYVMVQHLNDDPSGIAPQIIDSTANAHDGVALGNMTASNSINGKLSGKALQFDGIDDVIEWIDLNVYNLALSPTFTVSAWIFIEAGGEETSETAWGFAGPDDLVLVPYDDFYYWNSPNDGNGVRSFWRNLGGNWLNEN